MNRFFAPGSDEYFMAEAYKQAQKARKLGEVPIGAVIVSPEGRIIARGWNQVETLKDATAHAEMIALTSAQEALGDWRLEGCTLYVTKEPCPMCAGALVHCRPERVVFAISDPKGGAAGGWINLLESSPPLNHRCDITQGILEQECLADLQSFFKEAREEAKARKKAGLPPLLQADKFKKEAPDSDAGTPLFLENKEASPLEEESF